MTKQDELINGRYGFPYDFAGPAGDFHPILNRNCHLPAQQVAVVDRIVEKVRAFRAGDRC